MRLIRTACCSHSRTAAPRTLAFRPVYPHQRWTHLRGQLHYRGHASVLLLCDVHPMPHGEHAKRWNLVCTTDSRHTCKLCDSQLVGVATSPGTHSWAAARPSATLPQTNLTSTWNLIDGWLRVEYKNNSGTWVPVTKNGCVWDLRERMTTAHSPWNEPDQSERDSAAAGTSGSRRCPRPGAILPTLRTL